MEKQGPYKSAKLSPNLRYAKLLKEMQLHDDVGRPKIKLSPQGMLAYMQLIPDLGTQSAACSPAKKVERLEPLVLKRPHGKPRIPRTQVPSPVPTT